MNKAIFIKIKNNPFRTLFEVLCMLFIIIAVLSSGKFSQLVFEHLWQTGLIILLLGTLATLLDILFARYNRRKGVNNDN